MISSVKKENVQVLGKKVCFDINRLGKRDSGYSYKKIRSTVQPLLDVAEKVKQDISSENPDICDLEERM